MEYFAGGKQDYASCFEGLDFDTTVEGFLYP
jgi:hypothetical protein